MQLITSSRNIVMRSMF